MRLGCFCNYESHPQTYIQTVMSGSISVSFVYLAAFSFRFNRVRCVSVRSFLVRNWRGEPRVDGKRAFRSLTAVACV